MTCPQCSAETPPGSRFCLNCGARLAEQKPAEGERRIVTVLFCDVKGSTTLAESIDPEEWTEIMNGAFDGLIPPISRYEGTVVRLLGDAVLAFFGAPTAHEDDPERAVLAGLEMLDALAVYRRRLARERGIEGFDIRIGINTGLAVIGDVGSGQRVEYTAMGDAVNVAARLQSVARPGTVVIGDATYRAVAPLFDLDPLGAIELKGRTEAVPAFEVRGRAATVGKRRGLAGTTVPVIGRDAELRIIFGILDDVRAGRGRIVSLIGEPGIGKSRLIEETRRSWRASARNGRPEWTETRCESYTGSQAYLVFRASLLGALGATAADPPAVVRERIADALGGEPAETRERSARILEGLVGLGDVASAGLDGEALAAEIRRLARVAIQHAADPGPTAFAFDDLHWSDSASGELLLELFALSDELPILFLLGMRPDRQAVGWRVKQGAESKHPQCYQEIALSPLRPDDGGALVARVLDPNELPASLRDRIAAKADGNPFFLEEIVRSLTESGAIGKDASGVWRAASSAADMPLPENVQRVLAARIDRLGESARRALQAASVIGRTFAYRVLAEITDGVTGLDGDLATLQRAELVSETATIPEREFTFRHALTQDAAYGSMLLRRRRELHRRVAEVLLALRADRAGDEDAGIIGSHFAQAGDERAVAFLVRAGDHARRLYALDEALAHYDRALAQAKGAETTLLGQLYAGRGRTLELRGDHDAAIANYEELSRAATDRGDREVEGLALAMLASIYSTATTRRDVVKAEELLGRALAIARERDDQVLLAKLQESHMWLAYFSDDLAVALDAGEEAVRIDRALGRSEDLPVALNNVSHIYRDLGRFADAEAAGTEATDRFRALGNKSMLADSLSTRSQALICVGQYGAVLRHTDQARALSEEATNAWGISYADYIAPFVHHERGDVARAIERWRSCLEHGRRGGFVAAEVGSQSMLADLFRDIGALDLADAHASAALEAAQRAFPQWLKWPLAMRARIELALGRPDRARAAVAESDGLVHAFVSFPPLWVQVVLARAAVALAEGRAAEAARIVTDGRVGFERQGIVAWLPDLALLEGEALAVAGDAAGAHRAYQVAREAAERIGSRRTLWRACAALGERDRARETVVAIGASLDRIGLRGRFDALPEVRAIAT